MQHYNLYCPIRVRPPQLFLHYRLFSSQHIRSLAANAIIESMQILWSWLYGVLQMIIKNLHRRYLGFLQTANSSCGYRAWSFLSICSKSHVYLLPVRVSRVNWRLKRVHTPHNVCKIRCQLMCDLSELIFYCWRLCVEPPTLITYLTGPEDII